MSYQLVHHDLISLPGRNRGKPGLYWLRLYRGAADHAAVITEVPGNPSLLWVTTAIGDILSWVAAHFGASPDRLMVFCVWPRRSGLLGDPSVERGVLEHGQHSWVRSSKDEIVALVGALPDLPGHAELYGRVLSAGGGCFSTIRRPVFEAVRVTDLPPPENPYSCEHHRRFDAILEELQDAGGVGYHQAEAGRVFLRTLTTRDVGHCSYHRADWKQIADSSVQIIRALGRRSPSAYIGAVQQQTLPTAELRWLTSLFDKPINIDGGGYINGQHRGCALRFSGAKARQ